MQPFWFLAAPDFDPGAFAREIGATCEGSVLRRRGGSVHLGVQREVDHARLTLAATWTWPWRWPACSRLERDVLRALAQRGVRGADATSEDVLGHFRS